MRVSRHTQSHVCTHTRERMFGFLLFAFKMQWTKCTVSTYDMPMDICACIYLHTRMHACVHSLVCACMLQARVFERTNKGKYERRPMYACLNVCTQAHADFAQCDSWMHGNRNTVWILCHVNVKYLFYNDCLPAKCCSRSLPWRCTLAPERDISMDHSVGQYPKVHSFIRLITRHISVFFLSEMSLWNSYAAALCVLNSTPRC